jgi:hypothetical protein
MVLSRGPGGGIVQSTGTVFDGEGGKKYAKALEGVVEVVSKGIVECDEGVCHYSAAFWRMMLIYGRMSSSS